MATKIKLGTSQEPGQETEAPQVDPTGVPEDLLEVSAQAKSEGFTVTFVGTTAVRVDH